MSKRRKIVQFISAGSLSLWLSGFLQQARSAGSKPVVPGLHKIEGEVRVNGQVARQGQAIGPGDTVVTGAASLAIYVIGGDAFLQRENTTVSLGTGALQDVLRLITGKLLSVFAKGERRIQTPTATIGIRGTGCYLEAEEKRVYFCLCYGTADVSPLAEPGRVETITTRHHDHPVYLHADSGMPMMAPATVINHSDAELILLENLVGRWPPFYGQGERY